MSNTAALALVVASLFVGGLAYFCWSTWVHDLVHQIVTGAAGNPPLPLASTWRWYLLHTRFVYSAISTSASAAVTAMVNFVVAKLASDPHVQTVAYVATALSAVVAGGYLLHSALEFIVLRRILRQAEAD